jgi:hypothetical protein
VEFPAIGNNSTSVTIKKGNSLAPPATDPNDRRYYLLDDLLDSLTSAQHHTDLSSTILEDVYIKLHAFQAPGVGRPFIHNQTERQANQATPVHQDSLAYWNTAVVLAFEDDLSNDHDPGLLLSNGPTPVFGRAGNLTTQPVAFVFLETMRDFWTTTVAPCKPTVSIEEAREATFAHERLHTLTLDHTGDTSGGLMCTMLKNDVTQPNRLKITGPQKAKLRAMTSPDTMIHENESCPYVACPAGANCGLN